MRCLTVRQPWAWAIFYAAPLKDIENRTWRTRQRGRIAIHAAKGLTTREYSEGSAFIRDVAGAFGERVEVPAMDALPRGVVLGTIDLFGCVEASGSPWFVGPYGLALRHPQPLQTPVAARGALGFWEWRPAS